MWLVKNLNTGTIVERTKSTIRAMDRAECHEQAAAYDTGHKFGVFAA